MAYTTINKSTDYFNTKLYSGNGSTNTAQTGVGFQPDWTWIKERSSTSSHIITDAVRGANKSLSSNLTSGQATETQSLISFDSDGFTVGSGGGVNENSQTYAAWNWKANGAGSSNTDGSITSTVSANTTSGFSIVQYVGTGSAATVGHGLGTVPKMMLVKKTSGSESWAVYHHSIGNTKFLQLNTSGAEGTSSGFWNDTTPTSSVFSIKSDGGTNASGQTYIAYCFAEKQGFSKFGTYTGNGNADNTFIYTGFKPAWIMTKKTAGSGYHWFIFDNKRDGYNNFNKRFEASSNVAEADTSPTGNIDILSNGFKIRTTDGHIADAGEYIYIAFAKAPLVGSNNVPATAR